MYYLTSFNTGNGSITGGLTMEGVKRNQSYFVYRIDDKYETNRLETSFGISQCDFREMLPYRMEAYYAIDGPGIVNGTIMTELYIELMEASKEFNFTYDVVNPVFNLIVDPVPIDMIDDLLLTIQLGYPSEYYAILINNMTDCDEEPLLVNITSQMTNVTVNISGIVNPDVINYLSVKLEGSLGYGEFVYISTQRSSTDHGNNVKYQHHVKHHVGGYSYFAICMISLGASIITCVGYLLWKHKHHSGYEQV